MITGDGEQLMGMGGLATIGVKRPQNLVVVVLDNGHYGETGMQASHTTGGVDLVAVAKACGFADGLMLTEQSGVAHVRELMHKGKGPILVNARISNAETPRVLPTRDGHAIKSRFMQAANALRRVGKARAPPRPRGQSRTARLPTRPASQCAFAHPTAPCPLSPGSPAAPPRRSAAAS